MRGISVRVAALAVTVCLSGLLSGCKLSVFHVLIPDFVPSQVKGVVVYQVQQGTDQLVSAGRIVFGAITTTAAGERMPCMQYTPDGRVFGPIDSPVRRRAGAPGGVELQLPFVNWMPSGWFRVASFNAAGASQPSQDGAYMYGAGAS